VQAVLVDPAHAARGDGHARRGADHQRVEGLPLFDVVDLRVVEAGERPYLAGGQALVVEQHSGRDQRPGEASAPRLVGPRDEAAAVGAIEAEEAARRPLAAASTRLG
jgi:hypothetical protein